MPLTNETVGLIGRHSRFKVLDALIGWPLLIESKLPRAFGRGGNVMAADWSPEFDAGAREWCAKIAALSVDVLVDAGIVARADFELARRIVAEEVMVRLCLQDYPPALEEPPLS